MFCIYCGTELPGHAKFCSHCGKPVEAADKQAQTEGSDNTGSSVTSTNPSERCEIVYVSVQEKIGLFPKEKGRYEAIRTGAAGPEILAASPVFELGGLNIYGPQEKVSRHKEPLEELAGHLKAEGWVQSKKAGPIWYNLHFER